MALVRTPPASFALTLCAALALGACTPPRTDQTLSGTIVGLEGSGLTLTTLGVPDVVVAAGAGSFRFEPLASGSTYAVEVKVQPSAPAQTCVVANGVGTIGSVDVRDVVVTCTTNRYRVGGTIAGLDGTGLTLALAGQPDQVLAPGAASFEFPQDLASGAAFSVTIVQQPSNPIQACVLLGATGVVGAADVVVELACENTYAVGGTIAGLAGAGLRLETPGQLPVEIPAGETSFTFAARIATGEAYDVTVAQQPTNPSQTCVVSSGAGIVGDADVAGVAVTCTTNTYEVGGTVAGLAGTGLTVALAGHGSLQVPAGATSFVFPTPLPSGSAYAVTVSAQPTGPHQTCTLGGGNGTVTNAPISSVAVTCTTNTYELRGTVSGLAGAGLTLSVGGQPGVAVAAGATTFVFPVRLASGTAFTVSVAAQPTSPWQACTVANGSGTVGGADVTSVAVTCTTNVYQVSGTVAGLSGTGLSLAIGGQANLPVQVGATAFAFPVGLPSGTAFTVSVAAQPTSPGQTCTVANGSGAVGGADVTNVAVTCTTNTYVVRGTVSGLTGSGLSLAIGGQANLAVPAAATTFAFPVRLASGTAFTVSVAGQPTSPWQTCTVANASGTVVGADVTDVAVACTTNTYEVRGTVSGLAGGGLTLAIGQANLPVAAGATTFAFPGRLASGAAFAVTVAAQPSSPWQTCTVANGSGTVGGADVTNVAVTCTTNTYALRGTVSGLQGGGLALAVAGQGNLVVAAGATSFAFPTGVASGTAYAVTVAAQPTSPWQTCTVANGSGTVGGADVTSVAVTCTTNTYVVRGTVSGLTGSGLSLAIGGQANLAVPAGATTFAFPTRLASGTAYTVAVAAHPAGPEQFCTVSNGAGTVAGADVTSVAVSCVGAYRVGGTVSGLSGAGLVLRTANEPDLTVAAGSTTFAFANGLPTGASYAVSVVQQPTSPWQTCAIASGSGTVGTADVASIVVTCTANTYQVRGTVSGLAGGGLALAIGGQANLSVAAGATTFAFPTRLASGTAFTVSVAAQPASPWQTCAVTNGSGTVSGADVTNVAVNCTTNTYAVRGTVTGLAGGGLSLAIGGQANLSVAAGSTTFAFPTRLASGTAYAVTVAGQPTSPWQTCTVTSGSGTVGGADVTNVAVTCTTNTYRVRGTVVGLQGSGLSLALAGQTNLSVAPGATSFAFPTPLASGSAYAVAVAVQPTGPHQTCSVSGGSGTVGGADVTGVTITCVTNTYTLGGVVSGLEGTGLALAVAGQPALVVPSGATSFAFPTRLASGTAYLVSVAAQPASPTQICTVANGSGNVAGADITNVAVTCTRTYRISGTVSGLEGNGLVLATPGQPNLAVPWRATSFAFQATTAPGSAYAVAVLQQPNDPSQICTIANGTGTMPAADVTNVAVSCRSAWWKVAAGSSHSAGIRPDGTLWTWGSDQFGALGDGNGPLNTTQRPIFIGPGYAEVTVGTSFTAALKPDGTLWTWGSGTYGSLGNGGGGFVSSPAQIGTGFVAVSAGDYHALALKADGTLWAWGLNDAGQVGNGAIANQLAPVQVGVGFAKVRAGYRNSFAIKADGTLWAWGANDNGQLGDGTTTGRRTPVQVGTGYVDVATDGGHTLGLRTDGALYAWGANTYGQLGDGTTAQRTLPIQVGIGYVQVAAGIGHSVGLKNDGTVWTWGSNANGELGDPAVTSRATPAQVPGGATAIASGASTVFAIGVDGTLTAWGGNYYGQIGDGTGLTGNPPILVGTGFAELAAGNGHSLGVKLDGTLWAWGRNSNGQLGDGSTAERSTPVQVGSGYRSVAASARELLLGFSLGAKTDGTLWAWGYNAQGQLGDGTGVQRNFPVQIGSGFAKVAAGASHAFGVKSDGTLWAWGSNGSGQLGDGSTMQRSSPVQVGTGFSEVAAGQSHGLGVKADGTLWGWGSNGSGQVGDGTITTRTAPVQIGTGYVAVAAGSNHSLALRTDGTLWGWGSSAFGQVGDGSIGGSSRLLPKQIGSGFTWVSAGDFCSLAGKADGTLWAWGRNTDGQLGDGTRTNRSSPAQVEVGFVAARAGGAHVLALDGAGTSWAWGSNQFGELGNGGYNKRSPVPIP